MKADDRFDLHMTFSMERSGNTSSQKPWVLDNSYSGLDYGQVVTVQAVVTKVLGEALVAIGIAQAGEIGFDVETALRSLEEGSQQPRRGGVMR